MDYDHLPVSDGSGDAALMNVTTLRLPAATTIVVDSVVNVPSKFVATYGTLDDNGFIDPTTKRDFKGHVSGSDLVIDSFEPGNVDDGNAEGDVVVIKPNTGWANRVATHIKNMTGFGTPENATIANLTAADITAIILALSGSLTVTGTSTLNGGTVLPAGDIGTADVADHAITFAKLLATAFGGQVQSFVNGGTAGGTFYYVNLLGIKLLWGVTDSLAGGPSANYGIALPTFFTTIQGGFCSVGGFGSDYGCRAGFNTSQPTTGSADIVMLSAGGDHAYAMVGLIGT